MRNESFFRDAVKQFAVLQAERLAEFLNAADAALSFPETTTGPLFRAMQIFESCQKIEARWRQSTSDKPTAGWFKNINALLEGFSFVPVLNPLGSDLWVWWRQAPDWNSRREVWAGGSKHSDTKGSLFSYDVIRLILNMTEAGTLNRIRKCHCGRYFFAQTNKKRVCSTACRLEKFNRDHPDYMSKYRKTKTALENRRRRRTGQR